MRVEVQKKIRDVTSHTFAQTTHVALPPPRLSGRGLEVEGQGHGLEISNLTASELVIS